MTFKWEDINYLKKGSKIQNKAYDIIKELQVLNILSKYNPILVGTIPIRIDVEGSDLDIICEVYDFEEFETLITENFGNNVGFNISKMKYRPKHYRK